MENRFRVFLLNLTASIVAVCLLAQPAIAADKPYLETEPVMEPDLERREIIEPEINKDDFEVGLFAGLLSIEDFGTNPVYGIRGSYHITEDFFAEVTIGMSEADKTSFELLSGDVTLLTDDQRDYQFYSLSLGYNLLPGEVFIGENLAFNTSLYLIGGIGSTNFADSNHFTVNVGAGYRFLASDSFAIHIHIRDHLFNSDLLGEDETTHNIEFSGGITAYF